MKFIEICSKSYPGQTAIVDDEDFEALKSHKWTTCLKGSVIKSPGPGEIRKTELMHRIITRAKPGEIVDHKNGNPKDNRRENLRICSSLENSRNSKKPCSGRTSRYKGVSYDKRINKFQAVIRYGGKLRKIATCKCESGAALAYNIMACILFDEFSRLNVINSNRDKLLMDNNANFEGRGSESAPGRTE